MSVAITADRVFDGDRLLDGPQEVSMDDGRIVAVRPTRSGGSAGAIPGTTLLPGLIDAHVHLRGVDDLRALERHGVTTALDMGSWPPTLIRQLRAAGSTDVRSTGAAAVGPGSRLAHIPGRPADSVVADAAMARRFVAARVDEGVDYVKVIVEPPERGGLEPDVLDAVVHAAHQAGRLVVAHASDTASVAMAQGAGVDVLTHAPLDAVLDPVAVEEVARSGRTSVPTLIMMTGVAANAPRPGIDYAHSQRSVTALRAAGVPLVLGTDANQLPGVPANVPYGSSAHDELALLVGAGLSPLEALRAATSVAADRFGLLDRGRVAPGLRADLLLVAGDPSRDIGATRAVRDVFIEGRSSR